MAKPIKKQATKKIKPLAKITQGRTAAIAASREATKAQTAPGTEYKAARAAGKAAGGGYWGGGAARAKEAKKKKEKEASEKRMGMIASMRERLKAGRSKMPTFGGR